MGRRVLSSHRQGGSALIVAIFLVVVMGLLSASLLSMKTTQQQMTIQEVISTRAWWAAHSGMEWGLTQVLPLHGALAVCEPKMPFPLSPQRFHHCSIMVSCQVVIGDEIEDSHRYYRLESTAQCGTGRFAVTRVQESLVQGLPQGS